MIQLLLVEDDPILGRALTISLENAGYKVHWARALGSAKAMSLGHVFDLVILDLGLPDGDGLDFLKKLRESGSQLPVVILTAQTDEETVVEGLQSGANDYVRKPFGKRELVARIKTALKEPQAKGDKIRAGDLQVLIDQRKIIYREKEIQVKRKEFDLITHFVRRFGMVISREELLNILSSDEKVFDRTVDSYVSHIRTKLRKAGVESICITSVYGVGYRMESQ